MVNTPFLILNNALKKQLGLKEKGLKCVLTGNSYDIVMEEIFLTDKAFEWELEKNSQSESYRIFNALAGHGKNLS